MVSYFGRLIQLVYQDQIKMKIWKNIEVNDLSIKKL